MEAPLSRLVKRASLVAAIAAICLPGIALADVTADFDAYPAETTITNQYADLGGPGQGVVFGPLPGGQQGWRPVVKAPPAGQAQSGAHVADISVCNTGQCNGFEFYPGIATGTFQSGRTRVSARVGLAGPAGGSCTNSDNSGCSEVTLQAYDANGDPVGAPSTATVQAGAGFHTLLSVTTAGPVIRGFKVSDRNSLDDLDPVAVDDVSFDVPGGPPPADFTLTPASTFLVMSQGQTLTDHIAIGRTTGSSGDVQLALSGALPDGVRASFAPNPAGGDATDLILTADPDSATTGFNPIDLTVTATPLTPSAGAEQRTFPVRLQVRSAFDLSVPGPSSVDLAGCVVRVPVQVSRDFGFPGPVQLSVGGLANGGGASFEPAQITFPNGAGAETANLVVTAPPTGLPVPITTLTVAATAPGYPSRTAQVSVHGTCPAQYDARVTSLEITQGVQTGNLPTRLANHPTAPIPYSQILGAAKLHTDAPTIVRVYANLLFGPSGGADGVPLVLYGAHYDRFGQPKAIPGGPLSPVSGVRHLDPGSETPTAAEAASETDVYTFVLPPDWTNQELAIGANLSPALGGGPRALAPCTTQACVDNDSMGISHIPFVGTRHITINPLDLQVAGAADPDPNEVFKWARMMAPMEIRVNPYQTTVDISDLSAKLAQCLAAAPAGDAGKSARQKCSNDANHGAADRVNDYTCDQSSHDRTWNIGVNTGVARGRTSSVWCWSKLSTEHDAVVEYQRPITSVAHELGHLLGRPHSDRLCGGNSDGQTGEAWPPDDRGYLQSTGLTTTAGTGINGGPFAVLAPPKQWYDYMSYCAASTSTLSPIGGANAWISLRNWNKLLDSARFKRGAGPVAAARGAGQPSLHVTGTVADSGTSVGTVEPVTSPPQPASPSPYHLVASGPGGGTIADVAMIESGTHVDGQSPETTLDAVVPAAGVTRVAIVKDGVELASRAQSTKAPSVKVPRAPTFKGRAATLRFGARDRDGGDLLAKVDYSADGGRTYEQIWTGASRAAIRVPARLLPRARRARLRVSVNDGFRERSALSPRFRSPGAPPEVAIVSPVTGLEQPNDAPLALSGRAFDDRSVRLTGRRLRWMDGRRVLGRGERIAPAGLSPGRHRISLVARDRFGRTSRAAIRVRLTGARPLFLKLTAPKKVGRRARSLKVRVASSLPSRLTLTGGGGKAQRFAVGRHSRKLRVRVRRGSKPLRLRLKLRVGHATSVRTVVVRR